MLMDELLKIKRMLADLEGSLEAKKMPADATRRGKMMPMLNEIERLLKEVLRAHDEREGGVSRRSDDGGSSRAPRAAAVETVAGEQWPQERAAPTRPRSHERFLTTDSRRSHVSPLTSRLAEAVPRASASPRERPYALARDSRGFRVLAEEKRAHATSHPTRPSQE